MNKHTRFALIAAALSFIVAGAALAEPPGRGQGRGFRGERGPNVERMTQHLGLTDAQVQQVTALMAEKKKATRAVRKQMRQKHTELQGLWAAENPDKKAILAVHAEIDALRATQRSARRTFHQALDNVLTDEQKAKRSGPRGSGKRGMRGMRGQGGKHFGKRGKGGRGMRGMGGGQGPNTERMAKHLGLSAAQRQQVETLVAQKQAVTKPLRAQMQQKRTERRELLAAGTPNAAAMARLDAEMDSLRTSLREARIDFRLALSGVLTAEQRQKKQDRMQRRKGGRGGHGMGRGGKGYGGAMFGDDVDCPADMGDDADDGIVDDADFDA